jgi:hypothetical protein
MKNFNIKIQGSGLPAHLALLKYHKNNKINWNYVDTNFTLPMSSTLDFIPFMQDSIDFSWSDLKHFNGNLKTGVTKINFNNNTFESNFKPPFVALHFDSLSMSKYLFNKCKYIPSTKADIVIDADKPNDMSNYINIKHVPTNCAIGYKYKDKNAFTKTKIEAAKHGWIQTIPTRDYVYVNYIFNSDINNPQDIANSLPLRNYNYQLTKFSSYYTQNPFLENKLKLGLNSFFIEPFDATSLSGNLRLLDLFTDYQNKHIKHSDALYYYFDYIKEIMEVLMLHYVSEVPYKTEFWRHAKDKAEDYLLNTGIKKRDISNFYSKEGYEKLYKNLNVFSYIQ